jgi:hypothetical protein
VERPTEKTEPSVGEMIEEVLNLVTGLGVMLLPVLILAVPALVLLAPLLLLALPLVLAGAVFAPVYLVIRVARRRPAATSSRQRQVRAAQGASMPAERSL